MKAHYAFKEQVAMVDFTYNEGKTSDAPLAKVYIFARCVSLSLICSPFNFMVCWLAGLHINFAACMVTNIGH